MADEYGGLRVTARDNRGAELGVHVIRFADYSKGCSRLERIDKTLRWRDALTSLEMKEFLKEAELFATFFGLE